MGLIQISADLNGQLGLRSGPEGLVWVSEVHQQREKSIRINESEIHCSSKFEVSKTSSFYCLTVVYVQQHADCDVVSFCTGLSCHASHPTETSDKKDLEFVFYDVL